MSFVYKNRLIALAVLLLSSVQSEAFKITYKSGPYESIEIAVIKSKKDMDNVLWHAANYLGLKNKARATALGSTIGYGAGAISGTAAGIGAEIALGSDEDFALAGLAVGSTVGAVIGAGAGYASEGLGKKTFKEIKKHYGAHYIEKVKIGKTACRDTNSMKGKNLLPKKDDADHNVYVQLLDRYDGQKGTKLRRIGSILPINPFGQYEATISKNEKRQVKVNMKEVSSSGGDICN